MYIVHVCGLLAAPPVSTKHELVLGGAAGALYQVSHHPRQPQLSYSIIIIVAVVAIINVTKDCPFPSSFISSAVTI